MKSMHGVGNIIKTRFRFSGLLFRITASLAGVILFALAALGFYSGRITSNALSESAENALQGEVFKQAQAIENFLNLSRSDLFFLKATPPIQGILRAHANKGVDPLDGTTTQVWENRLSKIFLGMARNKRQYMQLRFIAKDGLELVRVDSDGAKTLRIPDKRLANKSSAGYFKETMKLEDKQLFISSLNLNKEKGKIQIPYVPVIRYATPVFNNAGSREGILIANIFAKQFTGELKKRTDGKNFYLVNEDGFFLMHPDESKEWGFMLNQDTRVQNDFSTVAKELLSRNTGTIGNFQGMVISHVPVTVQKGQERYWKLMLSASRSEVLETVNDFWVFFAFFIAGTFVLSIIAAALLARSITKPIGLIVEMIGKMKDGDLKVRMNLNRSDEIGIIASTLDDFADNLGVLVDNIRSSSNKVSGSSANLPDIANDIASSSEENAFTMILRDISDHKKAEEALRESRELEKQAHARLIDAIESLPGSFTIFDAEDCFVLSNSKTLEIFPDHAAILKPGTSYEEMIRASMEKGLIQVDPGEPEAFIQKRLREFRERPDTIEQPLTDGRWFAIYNRTTSDGGTVTIRLDITERKKAEELLRESELKFRDLAETSQDLIWRTDREGRFTYLNPAWESTLGYSLKEMIGHEFPDFKRPEEREQNIQRHHRTMQGDPATIYESIYISKTGEEVILYFKVKPLFDVSGQIVGAQGTATDITERKRAEAALKRSEEHLAKAQQIAHLGSWEQDVATGVVQWSDETFRIFGIQPKEFGGTTESFSRLVHPEDRERVRTASQIAIKDSTLFNSEFRIVRPDGDVRWIHEQAEVIHDENGDPLKFFGTSLDITERKQARMELSRMATALEQAGDCIFITDTDGAIRYVNSAFERITGYTREEAIGQNPRILKSGKMEEGFYREMWEILLRGEVWQGRLTNRRKDGTLYEVDGTNAPLRNEQGEIINFIAVQKDITEQTQLEEQLRQSQKMEALGNLAGGIAHDFNNVLTPILGYSEMLQKDAEPKSKEMNYLEVIYQSAFRAKELVSQILLFSRQAKSVKRISDLSPIVEEVTNFMRSTLPKWITVQVEIPEDLTPVLCNSSQLHQVLVNLCVNAGQAMPDTGELRITLKLVNLDGFKCIIGKSLSGKYVRIAVTDTGTGMDSETLTHIFDPFFTTKEMGEGTGLGLSTVFGIVQEHSGGIRVTSQPSQGSTFEIFLPAVEQPIELAPASETTVSTGDETIFYIDDEEPIANLGKIILEGYGYKVTIGLDSRKALKMFKENPKKFDLIVTDQGMPKLKGEHLAIKLRQIRPDIPVILCTGHSKTMTPEKSKASGINAFLYKPVEAKALGRIVRRVLDEAKKTKPTGA